MARRTEVLWEVALVLLGVGHSLGGKPMYGPKILLRLMRETKHSLYLESLSVYSLIHLVTVLFGKKAESR